MKKDPIIEEIRAIRRELSAEAGNDIHEICRRLAEREKLPPERIAAEIPAKKRRMAGKWKDPIVEEVRAIRRALAAEAGNDLHRMCEEARAWERANPERMAAPKHKRKVDPPAPGRSKKTKK